MKRLPLVLILSLGLLLSAPAFSADAGQGKAQEFCPVMGGRINKGIYADYQGKRVYFCCGYCVGEFQKDPEKYLGKLKEQGVEPEKTPEQAEKKEAKATAPAPAGK